MLRGRDDVHSNQDFSYRAPLPDLVPGVPDHSNGTVSVSNIGNGHARASKLVMLCGVQLAGRQDEIHGCNAVLPADISAYSDPAFPGQVIVKIPPLPPGGSYRHKLTFWPASLRNGSYGFQVHADHGREVVESNEENNTARTPKIEVNRPVKPPTNPDLSVDIYLVTSAQGAPRVPLDVKVGQPLFIQVAGNGRNGVLVNRIGWAGVNTGNPEMDSMHSGNSGDRPSDAHTWSIGAIDKPGNFTFCGYAWSTRDEQATRCMVVRVVDSRPDLVVAEARVDVLEPFYKVAPGWRTRDWNAIESSPPWLDLIVPYHAHVLNKGSSQADAFSATLFLNGRKYPASFPSSDPGGPLAPGAVQRLHFNVPVDSLWRDYHQGRNVAGTVTADAGNRIAESNESNNSMATKVLVLWVRPTNLQAMPGGGGVVQLVWVMGNGFPRALNNGYHIGVRYTLAPTGQPVNRRFQAGPGSANFTVPGLPWSQMKDNRACFRVVAYAYSNLPGYERLSAPSNEVCQTLTVRDLRN